MTPLGPPAPLVPLVPLVPPAGRTVVVATDFDRTFTRQDLKLSPDAVERARRLRRQGVTTVLVTGRPQAMVPLHHLAGCFDAMVLEGGAVWGKPGRWDVHPGGVQLERAATSLEEQGFDVRQGWASFSVEATAEDELARLPVEARRNHDRIDVTPPGVDKGFGLRRILAEISVPDPWVLAIGDSENDLPMFHAAQARVAVANAVPALAAAADHVAPKAAHQGFLWATRQIRME